MFNNIIANVDVYCKIHAAMFTTLQYIPRNMHTVFALLCFVVVIHWQIFPYPSGLLHWHCGNLTIAPVPAKQPWWIWINTSCEFIMNDCITTTKQSTTKPCAYFLGYTVFITMITKLNWWRASKKRLKEWIYDGWWDLVSQDYLFGTARSMLWHGSLNGSLLGS